MPDDAYIKGKDKNQLLKDLYGTAKVGSQVHEQQKAAITVRCVEDLEHSINSLKDSMNRNAESSQNLAKKVFWLNVVLTVATVVGTLVAVYKIFIQAS